MSLNWATSPNITHLNTPKMKQKLSVTLEEKTIVEIQEQLRSGRFRNKSHVVESAVKKLLEEEDG